MISLDAIRQTNREKVLNVLMDRREATRQELSRMTGMSVPTTTVIVNDLLEEGFFRTPASGHLQVAAGLRLYVLYPMRAVHSAWTLPLIRSESCW